MFPAHGKVIKGIDEISVEVPYVDDAHRIRAGAVIGKVGLHAFLVKVSQLERRQDRHVRRADGAVKHQIAHGGGGLILRDHGHAVIVPVKVPALDRLRDVPGDPGVGGGVKVGREHRFAVGNDAAVLALQGVPGGSGDGQRLCQRMKVDRDRALMAGGIRTVEAHDEADTGVDDRFRLRKGGETVQFCP